MSQLRKMKRQQQRNNVVKMTPTKVTEMKEDVYKKVGEQAYYAGLQKGMNTSFLFAIDTLEKTMEETKGIGEKKMQALRTAFYNNLHRKELFDNFMADEPKGEVYIVRKENQSHIKLVKDVGDVVYSEHSKLTEEDILSILNYEVTPIEELQSIINRLKGVTA
jgi:hypothetical protein